MVWDHPPQGDPGGPHNLHHSYSTAVGRPAIIHPSHLPRSCSQAQQARNLLMDLGDRAADFRFPVRDRAGQFTESFDAVLAGAGIEAVQIPPEALARTAARRGSCSPPGPGLPTGC